jgi:hypothetical protein
MGRDKEKKKLKSFKNCTQWPESGSHMGLLHNITVVILASRPEAGVLN